MKTFPEADVIWWNAKRYSVRCPFCESVHSHSVNWNAGKLRCSHCEKMETYLCCFPFNDQGEVAYEIDKRGRYINICVAHDTDTVDDDADDDVNRLATELAQKATITAKNERRSIYGDSEELVTIDPGNGISPFKQKRILGAVSDSVTGNTRAVQRYLETSDEASLFIQGRYHDGKTTLISVAVEQYPGMVTLLINHGAEVNAVDDSGRTALMEAALFGRIDNVKVLLQHNADRCIKDNENRLAIDFARGHHRNRREIYERSGGELRSSSNQRLGYVEDTFNRDIDRQEIVRLLGGENRKSKIVFGSPPTLSLSTSYSFTRSPMQDSLVLHGPIQEYPITGRSKTVARLERGGNFPSIGAMSGWSHSPMQFLRVDGRQWTDDVFYLSESAGHVLPSHPSDGGKRGQYYACRAEKQLIAYFIDAMFSSHAMAFRTRN